MTYDYQNPKPGDELLLDGIKFIVTEFLPGYWPRPDRIKGYGLDIPDRIDTLDAKDYVEAYKFAWDNYRDSTLEDWLAKYHAAHTKLHVGARHEPKRVRANRPKRYTIVGHAGVRYFNVEIVHHDGSRTVELWTRAQWLRFFPKSG